MPVNISAPEGTGYRADGPLYATEVQAQLLPLLDEGRGAHADRPGARRLRIERRLQQRRFHRLPEAVGGARPSPRRTWPTQVNRDARRRCRRCAAMRQVAIVAEPRARPADQLRHRRQRPMTSWSSRATASSPPPPTIPASSTSTPTIRKPSRSCGSRSIPTRAGDLGVSVSDVSHALQTLLGSRRVSTYVDRGEEYRVILQAEDCGPADAGRPCVRSIVRGRTGRWCRLSNLVTTREDGRPARPRPLQQAARDHPVGRPGRPAIRSARR